jgi:hypothetical protein
MACFIAEWQGLVTTVHLTVPTFSGVQTVPALLGCFFYSAEAGDMKFVIHNKFMFLLGTLPWWPALKHTQKHCWVRVTKSPVLKNVSMTKERRVKKLSLLNFSWIYEHFQLNLNIISYRHFTFLDFKLFTRFLNVHGHFCSRNIIFSIKLMYGWNADTWSLTNDNHNFNQGSSNSLRNITAFFLRKKNRNAAHQACLKFCQLMDPRTKVLYFHAVTV